LLVWLSVVGIPHSFPQNLVFIYRYADADAEFHSEYDKFSEQHDALIASRANARSRKFKQRVLGDRRPEKVTPGTKLMSGQSRPRSLVPGSDEPAAQVSFNNDVDQEEPQWEEGFKEKRDSLIEHFNLRWDARKVMWLPFPGTKK
jgi:hypothetical protein